MYNIQQKSRSKQTGTALPAVLATLTVLTIASASFIASSTDSLRSSSRLSQSLQTFHLCEAAGQEELLNFWQPFQQNQNFTNMDPACTGASASNPVAAINDSIPGVGNFSAGIISYSTPDTYTRNLVIRCVGWIDMIGNGVLSPGDPRRILDLNVTYSLNRSKVFDYTYFVNNYGWMDGFGPNDLVVNGDMRANGDFTFSDGSPTVNGSVFAAYNQLLVPPTQGIVTGTPVKWDDPTYVSQQPSNPRWRQGYSSAVEGSKSSSTYQNAAPFIFDADPGIYNNQMDGATLSDSTGSRSWYYNGWSNPTSTVIDPTPTDQVIMPDLSDLSYYQQQSTSYTDTKATYQDGTANPNFGAGAYIQTWNPNTNSYQTITTKGNISGSAGIFGSSAHPIIVHGPVTVSQDAVISGTVTGQGTIYAGRNVHIVGSIIYKNAPNFSGSDLAGIDNVNEKADALGLAARASVIMGDTSGFYNPYPLAFMMPPFTHPRYDDNGNYIPAYDATATDSTGMMKYQSVLGDAYIHSVSSAVNQIDAIMYTNFVGGGNIGTGGLGLTINGTIISKDESMVIWSLPMHENYDNRIKERTLTQTPLIDLQLPRSPSVSTNTWQDEGFSLGTGYSTPNSSG